MPRGKLGVVVYDTNLNIRFNSEDKEELKQMAEEKEVTQGELARLFIAVGMRKLKERKR